MKAYLPDQHMKEGLGIVQPSFGAITLEQKSTTKGTGNIVITFFNTGNSGIKGKKVQLHHAEDGTWTCETTVDGKYAGKSCSVVTALRATS